MTLLMEGEDLQAAELLVTQGTLFWAPAKTFPEWIAVLPTSKTGWWVKATGTRKEWKQITLEIRSVQRDELHRLVDISKGGRTTQHQSGAGMEAKTGLAGDGPYLGGYWRRMNWKGARGASSVTGKMKDEERPLYEIPETKNLFFAIKERDNGREARGQWSKGQD